MPTCKKCGHENKEGTKYCVNCGNILELTEAYIRKEKAKERTAVKNWVAYFLIFMGFCTLFGGLMTYATSVGTIIEDVTAQVATPYIIIGFIFMIIGFGILLLKTEDAYEPIEEIEQQHELTEFIKEGKAEGHISCGTCVFFGKFPLCQLHEKNPKAEPCVYYRKNNQILGQDERSIPKGRGEME